MLDQKTIDELKAAHGNAHVVEIPASKYDDAVTFAVKRPSRAEYKRFRAMLFKDDEKSDAMETLARSCVVYPDQAEVTRLFNERPALADKLGGTCAELAGGGGEAEAKKL